MMSDMEDCMTRLKQLGPLAALILILLLAMGALERTYATSSLFYSRCQACHSDDNATCAGCHQHRGTLWATADLPAYHPGTTVTVTLGHNGGLYGWIRGILYDHTGAQVAIATGPTGTGDDGQAGAVEFPVTLQAPAPQEAGDYTWEAAWFGASNTGTTHLEVRTPVTIHVEINLGAEEELAHLSSAGLDLSIYPNPMTTQGMLRFRATTARGTATLAILDAEGRQIRSLGRVVLGEAAGEVTWDGCNDAGRHVEAGTYFAYLADARGAITRTVQVLP